MWVYIGTSGLKNAYIGEYWWHPWANTLAYFPLETDQLDTTGNYTLSLTGTQQTVGYQFSWSELALNWTYTRVQFLNVRVKIDSVGSWITNLATMIDSWGMRYNWEHIRTPANAKKFQIENGSNVASFSSAQNTTTWTWYNIAFGVNSNYNYNAYINGSLVWSWTLSSIRQPSWSNIVFLFNQTATATFSKVIVEDVVWTDQEVLDYYNKTKADYWL